MRYWFFTIGDRICTYQTSETNPLTVLFFWRHNKNRAHNVFGEIKTKTKKNISGKYCFSAKHLKWYLWLKPLFLHIVGFVLFFFFFHFACKLLRSLFNRARCCATVCCAIHVNHMFCTVSVEKNMAKTIVSILPLFAIYIVLLIAKITKKKICSFEQEMQTNVHNHFRNHGICYTHSTELNPHNCFFFSFRAVLHVCNFMYNALSTIDTRIPTDSGMQSKHHVEQCFKPNQFGSISISTSSLLFCALGCVRVFFFFHSQIDFIESFVIDCHGHLHGGERQKKNGYTDQIEF